MITTILRNSSHLDRSRQIAEVLARHSLGYLTSILGLERLLPFHKGLLGHPRQAEPYTRPEHLRMALEELGATFIKLGQILSTRADLLPPDYQAELSKLQDAAPLVPSELIKETVEAELGRPIEELFAAFEPSPMAAASIGQAHPATLHCGTEVVVKVRRPGVVEQVEEGIRLGPRIIAAGPMLDGPKPMFPALSVALGDESEGRRMVSLLKKRGADFLKVYSLLPRDAYFAIADEANRQDIAFSGHVPESVSAAEASDAGQKSIEHLSGVRLACSSNEERLRKQVAEARAKADPSLLYQSLIQTRRAGTQTYDREKAEALFARFKKNGTLQVPTLAIGWALASIKEREFKAVSSAGKLLERPKTEWTNQDRSQRTLRNHYEYLIRLHAGFRSNRLERCGESWRQERLPRPAI